MTDTTRRYTTALWTALAAALLLGGYEFVRSASSTLLQEAYGKDAMVYAMAAMPPAVFALLWCYGTILTAFGPRRTLLITSLASAVAITTLTTGINAQWGPAAVALYLFREAYVVLLIEQYWSLLNSTLGDQHARKLNGPICGVASLGAIACGMLVSRFTGHTFTLYDEPFTLSTGVLPYLAAALTLPAMLCSDMAYRTAGEPCDTPPRHAPHRPTLALRQFFQNPMLACLFGVILATQVLSASIELRFFDTLATHFTDLDVRTAYAASVFVTINIAAGIMQFAATPLMLHWIPLRRIHLAIPLIHLVAISVMIVHGGLGSAVGAYVIFKSIDYSVFRAAKELLYIPLGFDARYRVKEVIDVMGYRLGKGGASVAFSLLHAGGFAVTGILGWAAISATVVWAALAWPLTAKRSEA